MTEQLCIVAAARQATKPRLLDLFSCAGVGALGYQNAGWDVTGVDINPQPRYPGTHIVADALGLDPAWIRRHFAAVHASPMCQRHTRLRHRYTGGNPYPNQIPATRELLDATGLPYVIENVEDARPELINPVTLCGTMFAGLRVSRHRLFEAHGFALTAPRPCPPRHPLHHTLDKRKAHYGRTDEWTDFVQVTGGGNSSKDAAADAMGVPGHGFTKAELNEGLPPAYTHWIGTRLMAAVTARSTT